MRRRVPAVAVGAVALAVVAGSARWADTGWAGERSTGRLSGPQDPELSEEEVGRLFRQAVVLGVPEAELARLIRSCRDAGFTLEEVSRVLTLVTRARLAGLPHQDLLNKIREGLAKGAGPESVQSAMVAKATTLQKAKGLVDTLHLEGWLAPDYPFAVQVVADALEAGAAPAEVLCSVREGRPCRDGAGDVRRAFQKMTRGK